MGASAILILLSAVSSSLASVIHLTAYEDSDCQVSTGYSPNIYGPYGGAAGFPPFQSFQLDRPMVPSEQLDFCYISVPEEGGAMAGCQDFTESAWNLDTSCRSINASTCVAFWNNEGLASDLFGVGWGWNGTVWENFTASGVERLALEGPVPMFRGLTLLSPPAKKVGAL